MACRYESGTLMQIYSTENFLMCLDLSDGFGLHQIVNEETAIGRASHEMGVPDVKEHVNCELIHMMACIFLNFNAGAGFYETV